MTASQRYQEYLLSDEWEKRRNAVLERARFGCEEICSEESGWPRCRNRADDVHHLTYKNIFNEPLEDLVALCRECHKKRHTEPRKVLSKDQAEAIKARVEDACRDAEDAAQDLID